MSRIDYSKWDNIQVSSEDDSPISYSDCRVTRFDTPKSVTIGRPNTSSSSDTTEKREVCYISKNKGVRLSEYVFGGKSNKGKDYYWNQSENNLKILIALDLDIESKYLRVDVSELRLLVLYKNETIFLEEFQFGVNDNDDTIFWSILMTEKELYFEPKRILMIEVEKKKIDSSLRVWWKNVFKGGLETDINRFKKYSAKEEARNQQFKDAWKKAHEEFKKNTRSKILI